MGSLWGARCSYGVPMRCWVLQRGPYGVPGALMGSLWGPYGVPMGRHRRRVLVGVFALEFVQHEWAVGHNTAMYHHGPIAALWGAQCSYGVSMGSLMCLCVPMGSVWGRCGICVGSLWGRYVPTAAPVAMAALPPPPLLAAAVAARPPPAALRLPSAGLGAAPPAAPPAGREDPRGIEPLRVGGGALWGWEDQRDRAAWREAAGPMGGPTG